MTDLNPVENTVEIQPTVDHEVGPEMIAAEVAEIVPEGEIPSLPSLDSLTDAQKAQLKEFQKRMELYNKSRSGHIEGDTHKMSDGVVYTVMKSGAYKRMGEPRKSRKATHRKEVANRKSGKK